MGEVLNFVRHVMIVDYRLRMKRSRIGKSIRMSVLMSETGNTHEGFVRLSTQERTRSFRIRFR